MIPLSSWNTLICTSTVTIEDVSTFLVTVSCASVCVDIIKYSTPVSKSVATTWTTVIGSSESGTHGSKKMVKLVNIPALEQSKNKQVESTVQVFWMFPVATNLSKLGQVLTKSAINKYKTYRKQKNN